jgi:predicted transcriptional regulator
MVHVTQAVLAIGDGGPVGRIELSRKLGIGEGAIRTVVKHLTRANIVAIGKDGCMLTKRGVQLYSSLRSRVSVVHEIDARQLALDKVSAAVSVRGAARVLRRGVEQRDAAIKAGATGACTLLLRGRVFQMPMGGSDDWKLNSRDALFQDLKALFVPKGGDVVVISSAGDHFLAQQGAMAAALTLIA